MTTTEAALRECPFCGSLDVEMRESITDAQIACNNCGARTGFVYFSASEAANAAKKRELAAAWNRRSQPSPASSTVGEVREDRVLLLASYCGGDTEGCTDERPCDDCLAMCNVCIARGTIDPIAGLDYLRDYPGVEINHRAIRAAQSLYTSSGEPASVAGEVEPFQLMQDFYCSDRYNPKAARPADNVQAAIAFTIERLSKPTPADTSPLNTKPVDDSETGDGCQQDAHAPKVEELVEASRTFALAIRDEVPDDRVIEWVAWTAGGFRRLCAAIEALEPKP